MNTERITSELYRACKILSEGGLVAVPTETVYGLAGNGLDPDVIEKIYSVKGRPEVKPISLMVSGKEAIAGLCMDVPEQAETLAQKFWPGPLTIVLKADDKVPLILRAGGATVGLRCPRQDQTHRVLMELNFPLAVPSANPSGLPSSKTAEQVMEYFDGKIEAVIDGGACDLGLESTVLDLSRRPYRILRQGALPESQIADALVDAMRIVGITGGSGCGKSTALEALAKRGALVLDCDEVYHELLEKNLDLIGELREQFPTAYLGGKIDRPKLAEQVFHSTEALQTLNRITHRYIGEEIRRRLRQHAMNGGRLAALDAIELIGSGLSEQCDLLIGVTASEDARVGRITARDGINKEAALARIRAQRPNEYFEQHCDVTLENNGPREEFLQKVEALLQRVL